MPLVLVGATGRWARELPDVTLTGEVADDELAAIYTGAHALVFPSDDEGFGLPPVEALACGTPVAACDVPALREVLDGRVTLSDGRRPRRAGPRRRGARAARARAAGVELGRRRRRDLGGLRAGRSTAPDALARRAPARQRRRAA